MKNYLALIVIKGIQIKTMRNTVFPTGLES